MFVTLPIIAAATSIDGNVGRVFRNAMLFAGLMSAITAIKMAYANRSASLTTTSESPAPTTSSREVIDPFVDLSIFGDTIRRKEITGDDLLSAFATTEESRRREEGDKSELDSFLENSSSSFSSSSEDEEETLEAVSEEVMAQVASSARQADDDEFYKDDVEHFAEDSKDSGSKRNSSHGGERLKRDTPSSRFDLMRLGSLLGTACSSACVSGVVVTPSVLLFRDDGDNGGVALWVLKGAILVSCCWLLSVLATFALDTLKSRMKPISVVVLSYASTSVLLVCTYDASSSVLISALLSFATFTSSIGLLQSASVGRLFRDVRVSCAVGRIVGPIMFMYIFCGTGGVMGQSLYLFATLPLASSVILASCHKYLSGEPWLDILTPPTPRTPAADIAERGGSIAAEEGRWSSWLLRVRQVEMIWVS